MKLLARDRRIPNPLRWAAAMGLLPMPGPLDELILLLVAGILWLFYPALLAEAWRQTEVRRSGEELVISS